MAITVTGANRHDSMAYESTRDAIPPVQGLEEHPRKRPDKLHADKGYDGHRCRKDLLRRGITARIVRGIESKDRLGRYRWVVERTHAWFTGFGKLRVCFERQLDMHAALLKLAAAIIYHPLRGWLVLDNLIGFTSPEVNLLVVLENAASRVVRHS